MFTIITTYKERNGQQFTIYTASILCNGHPRMVGAIRFEGVEVRTDAPINVHTTARLLALTMAKTDLTNIIMEVVE